MDGWMHVHLPTAFRRPMPVARLYDMLYARTVIDEGKKISHTKPQTGFD